VDALVEGKNWKPPANMETILKEDAARRTAANKSNLTQSAPTPKRVVDKPRNNQNDDWGWGEENTSKSSNTKASTTPTPHRKISKQQESDPGFNGNYGSHEHVGYNSGPSERPGYNSGPSERSGYNSGPSERPTRTGIASRALSSDEYFGTEDQGPPSSKSNQPNQTDEVLKAIGDGWNRFAVAAKSAAEVTKSTAEKLAEKAKEKDWGKDLSVVGSKVADTTTKGWNLVSDYFIKAKESVKMIAEGQQTTNPNNDDPQSHEESENYNSYHSDNIPQEPDRKPKHGSQKKSKASKSLDDWLDEDDKEKEDEDEDQEPSTDNGWDNDGWDVDSPSKTAKERKSSEKSKSKQGEIWDEWGNPLPTQSKTTDKPKPQKKSERTANLDELGNTNSPSTVKKREDNAKSSSKSQPEATDWDEWNNTTASKPRAESPKPQPSITPQNTEPNWDDWGNATSTIATSTIATSTTKKSTSKKKESMDPNWDNWGNEKIQAEPKES